MTPTSGNQDDDPGDDDDVGARPAASPPCSLHEVDPGYAGLQMPPIDARALAHWRRSERERLIAERLAIPAEVRVAHAGSIALQLDLVIGAGGVGAGGRSGGSIVSVYWPFRGECDLRPWMQSVFERGLRVALPLVIEKAQPLAFREWRPGCVLARGVWNIPYPAEGEVVTPDVVIAPLVGFDRGCYRLGYGGGFFDRTLAQYGVRPLTIGVGHAIGALPTIHPQAWDIPMDVICTGDGVTWRAVPE